MVVKVDRFDNAAPTAHGDSPCTPQVEAAVSKSVAKGVQLSVLEQMKLIERQLSEQSRKRKHVRHHAGVKRSRQDAHLGPR